MARVATRSSAGSPVSDFGQGVVVPLVLFTEHLHDATARGIEEAIAWQRMTPSERMDLMEAHKAPEHLLTRLEQAMIEEVLHIDLVVWAVEADEHLGGLEYKKSPLALLDLADHVRNMRRSGMRKRKLDESDWMRVWELWKSAAIELDKLLGSQPQWSKY